MAKFKNIVGTGLLDYVQNQINQREQIVNKQTRTPSDLQWLSNRTGWFRLPTLAQVLVRRQFRRSRRRSWPL